MARQRSSLAARPDLMCLGCCALRARDVRSVLLRFRHCYPSPELQFGESEQCAPSDRCKKVRCKLGEPELERLRTDLAIAEEARKADEQRCGKFMAEAATVREELGSSKLEIATLSEHQRAVESELQAKESSISEEVAELERLRAALAEAEAARLAGSKHQEELSTEAREAQDELASAKRDLSERTDPRQQWPGDAHEMSGWKRPRRQFLRQRSVSGLLKRRCRLLGLLPLRTRGE
ncbi:unnamed protein product [Symbiodinium sp. CCMP2592]|nr:unnamed protein product [Symbiodinium sp. CCMP2592]